MARRNVVFHPEPIAHRGSLERTTRGACPTSPILMAADHTRSDTIAGIAQTILDDAPSQFVLVAHGMCGFVAFEIMRAAPKRVEKLVLFATLAAGPTRRLRPNAAWISAPRGVAGNFAQGSRRTHSDDDPRGPSRRGGARGSRAQMALDHWAENFLRQQAGDHGTHRQAARDGTRSAAPPGSSMAATT